MRVAKYAVVAGAAVLGLLAPSVAAASEAGADGVARRGTAAAVARSVSAASVAGADGVVEGDAAAGGPSVAAAGARDVARESAATAIEPSVVATLDTAAAGGGARPLIGDVTGDGRLDVVMMQPHYVADDRFEGALVAALTAYDLEDGQLWQAGKVDPAGRNQGSDIPAEIWDVDGDGDNEVVAIMHPGGDVTQTGRFYVFDGRTGRLVRDFALPDPLAHDAIQFVNLSGDRTAREILLKDRYDHAWALDRNGDLLWTHTGNTGHYPWAYDIDDDDRQEIMIGYDMVGPDGQLIWRYDAPGHTDSMWITDITGGPDPELMLGGDAAIAFDIRTGTQIWRQEDIVETQNIMTGDFIPSLPGLESLGLDRIDRTAQGYDGLFLLDVDGQFVWKEARTTRGCWGSIPEPIHNWTGDYSDLIMVWNRGCGEPTTIMNGSGEVISVLDSAARLWHADFCGDDKEEVLEYVQGRTVTIKSNGACDLDAKVTGRPLPEPKRLGNFTRYTAGDSPRDLAADRRLRCEGRSCTYDLGRWHLLTGVELAFHRPGRHDYTVEVSKDGRHWTTVVDRRRNDRTAATQPALFSGLGRYVRVRFAHGAKGPAGFEVLGNR